ncbi:MAG: hypothetical protein QXN68_03800 [Thermoplasmata archaeon]
MKGGLIGRFPVYVQTTFSTQEEKWSYFLNVIKEINEGVYHFITNAPDGTLRILGPYKRKKSEMVIISSPFPFLFSQLLLTLPRRFKSKVSADDPYTEIVQVSDLFGKPGDYYIISDDLINLSQVAKEFEQFTGIQVTPKYIPLEFKNMKGKKYYLYRALTSETVALIKFIRFSGVGRQRSFSNKDVLIYAVQ